MITALLGLAIFIVCWGITGIWLAAQEIRDALQEQNRLTRAALMGHRPEPKTMTPPDLG